jgi:hypothetical protein
MAGLLQGPDHWRHASAGSHERAGKIYFETHLLPHLSLKGEVSEVAFDLLRADRSTMPVLLHVLRGVDEAAALQFYRFTIFHARERRRYERELPCARREAERVSAALKQLNDTLSQRVERQFPYLPHPLASGALPRWRCKVRKRRLG